MYHISLWDKDAYPSSCLPDGLEEQFPENRRILTTTSVDWEAPDGKEYNIPSRLIKNTRLLAEWPDDKEYLKVMKRELFRSTVSQGLDGAARSFILNAAGMLTCGEVGFYGLWRSHDDPEKIGYFPLNRRILSEFSHEEQRQHGIQARPGKVVGKILRAAGQENITRPLEEFLGMFRPLTADVEIVSGEDIRKWYLEDNYATDYSTGELGSSCMRYERCQPFLSIYTDNPDKIQMLIGTTTDRNGEKKLLARSILWTTDNGKKYHDRIYASSIIKEQMNLWLKEHKWLPCYRKGLRLTVSLSHGEHCEYPYMDSFKYLESDYSALTTNGSGYLLEDTEGGYEGASSCACCGEHWDEDSMTYIDGMGMICDDCLYDNYRWSDYYDEWIHDSENVVCDDCGEVFLPDDLTDVRRDGYARSVCSSCLENYIEPADDDELHHIEDLSFCENHEVEYLHSCPECTEEREAAERADAARIEALQKKLTFTEENEDENSTKADEKAS